MTKALLDLPEPHATVLAFLMEKIPPSQYLWALTGSAGLRLQGVDTPVHDLDLQTDEQTVFLLEKELSEFMKVSVHAWETEHTRSYHGQADINGLQVELLGDMRHMQADQTWSSSLDLESLRVWVEWQDHLVPVLSLAHEALAYERMGRMQKADLIRAVLRKESQ